MLELILVRHGETIENHQRIFQGQSEGRLSANGRSKNKLLAQQLKDFKIDAIYSSSLKRALETAEEIRQFHNIVLKQDIRLIERNMGILQGQKIPTNYNLQTSVEGMESLMAMKKRILSFLKEIAMLHQGERVLLVSHGISLQLITAIMKQIPMDSIDRVKLLENSSYTVFQLLKEDENAL